MSNSFSAGVRAAAFQAALEAEILEERATALGNSGRRLATTLARLAAFDRGEALPPVVGQSGKPPPDRATLLAEAREALWYLVVQREACGLWSSEEVLAAYAVPREVSATVSTTPMVWRRRR